MMNSTPTRIMDFLKENEICNYELLEFNERKGRFCYSIEKNKEWFFLKWNDHNQQYREHRVSLDAEHAIYRLLSKQRITPELVEFNSYEDFLITRFIHDGKTLRLRIKELNACNDDVLYNMITQTLSQWELFIQSINVHNGFIGYAAESDDLFVRYMDSLTFSGPLGTKHSKINLFYIVLMNKLTNKTNLKKGKKYIEALKNASMLVHGDFHANNVLVSDDTCTLIDFENIRKGLPEIELAYMYAQIALLIRKKHHLVARINNYINNDIHVIQRHDLFWKFYDMYYNIIRRNYRFYM